jgi:hypothetical protein
MEIKQASFPEAGKQKPFLTSNTGIAILLGLILAFFVVKCISMALTSAFSFDGAVFAQISQSLVRNSTYSTTYQGKLFDPIITTGIPVTLPAAIGFKFFGETFAAGLMISAIYLILTAFAIVYYLKQCVNLGNALVLLAAILVLGTPDLFIVGLGLYGEIPMLFYFVLFLIFLNKYERSAQKKNMFWAGFFLGLSYLTKTVILICIPAILLVAVFDFFIKRGLTLKSGSGQKRFFRGYILLAVGFAVPVFLFEIYRMISLGISASLHWWKDQFITVLQRAGVTTGVSDSLGMLGKISDRLERLSSYVGMSRTLIVFLLFILLISGFIVFLYGCSSYKNKQLPEAGGENFFSNDILVIIIVVLSYFGWWFMIVPTETTWFRYIFVGYILAEIWLVIISALLIKHLLHRWTRTNRLSFLLSRIIMAAWIGFLLVGSGISFFRLRDYQISFTDTPEKTSYLAEGKFIHDLPENAEIFGYGWWQAPVVAFTSGRTIENILTHPSLWTDGNLNDKYFVVDFYNYYLDPAGYKNILGQYDTQLVFSQGKNSIYKLISRPYFSYEEFTDQEKSLVSYSFIDFTKNDLDVYTRNVYIDEKNQYGKWAQDVSAYLLKYAGEDNLKLSFWVPSLDQYDNNQVELRIYTDRNLVYYYPISHEGSQEILLPLKDISGNSLEITLKCNATLLSTSSSRRLAIFLTRIELVK